PHLGDLAQVTTMDQLRDAAAAFSQHGYGRMFALIDLRAWLAPFGHVTWTAITAGALWRVKGGNPFKLRMLVNGSFLRTFSVPVILHMTWDSDLIDKFGIVTHYLIIAGLGVIGWYVVFLLVQQGLRQIKDAQLAHTRSELTKTQQVFTTTTTQLRMSLGK
ncbi:MAG TPA: PrsW family glutamic-type intramembrane protease, partial [Bryobacteraceae bacterium]|nr:PrsW family glutamic-type intramembrane protease [Bryobacteraceae bacterium]